MGEEKMPYDFLINEVIAKIDNLEIDLLYHYVRNIDKKR